MGESSDTRITGLGGTIEMRQLPPWRWVCWNLGGRYYPGFVPKKTVLASKRMVAGSIPAWGTTAETTPKTRGGLYKSTTPPAPNVTWRDRRPCPSTDFVASAQGCISRCTVFWKHSKGRQAWPVCHRRRRHPLAIVRGSRHRRAERVLKMHAPCHRRDPVRLEMAPGILLHIPGAPARFGRAAMCPRLPRSQPCHCPRRQGPELRVAVLLQQLHQHVTMADGARCARLTIMPAPARQRLAPQPRQQVLPIVRDDRGACAPGRAGDEGVGKGARRTRPPAYWHGRCRPRPRHCP